MNNKHITFEQMSQLFDNDLSTEEEKESLLDHIESCQKCNLEYQKLKNMMIYFSHLKNNEFDLGNLSGKTLNRIKARKRRKKYMRYIPAAAVLFLIIGVSIFQFQFIQENSTNMYSNHENVDLHSDAEEVIEIIGKNNANILKITDLYVEGNIPYKDFNKLRRELGFRKVVYSLSNNIQVEDKRNNIWRSHIEEVGTGSENIYNNKEVNEVNIKEKNIIFRVYR